MVQAADGTVWAAYVKSDAIATLDEQGRPGPPVQVGDGPLRIAELDGSLWVTSIRDGNLTDQVHAGAVWGACTKGERLVGFDPQTLRVVGRVPHRADPADELDSPALSRKGAQGVCIFWS